MENQNCNKQKNNYDYYEYEDIGNCRKDIVKDNSKIKYRKNGLTIDDNTVYEIDEECYKCLEERWNQIKKKLLEP